MIPEQTGQSTRERKIPKDDALRAAFETYDKMRRTRAQWLVDSSRRVCDLFQQPDWADPVKRVKAESCFEEFKDRLFNGWHFDSGKMEDTIRDHKERVGMLGRPRRQTESMAKLCWIRLWREQEWHFSA
jgi:salicylate hydroxylase